jgi:carbamoyl-phosphate synthase large subunit
MGWTVEQIHELTNIDPWFLAQMKQLTDFEDELIASRKLLAAVGKTDPEDRATQASPLQDVLQKAKQWGYSDVQIASAWGGSMTPADVRKIRRKLAIEPVYKLVDTCAAEFEASTPYYYSTYETPFITVTEPRTLNPEPSFDDEIRLTQNPKVIIIGGGPNRIGQGIEFDYCCVQAAFACRELGLESVMINSNPETVSTDYDTSDLLFFEPLTHEDILNICERLNGEPFRRESDEATKRLSDEGKAGSPSVAPSLRRSVAVSPNLLKGVIVQFGGQTPLNLAKGLEQAGVPILGTTVASIDAAGDREQFRALLQKLNLKQPANGIARNVDEARRIAKDVGYPVLVRPSFVLGGRAMEIVSDEAQLNYYMAHAVEASTITDAPILIDRFLDAAIEVDVDCLADFTPSSTISDDNSSNGDSKRTGQAIVIGVMEHIEEAGIHSGDSACSLPPYSLSPEIVARLKDQTRALARALRVRGLMNVQYAIKDNEIYVIEVNPRASRTVPFVSKATGIPWAKIAAKIMTGKSLGELCIAEPPDPKHTSVKEVVFPFSKFPGVDVILGPEMRSTGEVMGIDQNFELAFAKSQIAAGGSPPTTGTAFISVREADKQAIIPIAKSLADLGFKILATPGTYAVLSKSDIPAKRIGKLAEGRRPNISDYLKNGNLQLIINTPTRKGPNTDEGKIRALAVLHKVPIVTTITAAHAVTRAIQELKKTDWGVRPLQQYFATAR